jgi:hypothetical protein
MASEGEREVMALMLTTNAELVAGVLRKTEGTQAQSVAAIAATRALEMLVQETLRALVSEARNEGHTWAEIGDVLHVTRQAAFQRFGGETDRDVLEEPGEPLADAENWAVGILGMCLAGRWDEVRATFDARMKEAAPVQLLEAAVASVHAHAGDFVAMGVPHSEVVGDYTVVHVPMEFERGTINGQVAFNADEEVAGLFVIPADDPSSTASCDHPHEAATGGAR